METPTSVGVTYHTHYLSSTHTFLYFHCLLSLSLHLSQCLGGEDFDQRVMEYFIKMYKKKTGKDIRGDNRAVQKLRREVEKAKRALSSQHQTRIEIESFYEGDDFSETLTRARFEELNMVSAFSFSLPPSLPPSLSPSLLYTAKYHVSLSHCRTCSGPP